MNEQTILGLDVGERRIGVAISDVEARIAAPLTTIPAHPPERAIAQIARLVAERGVRRVVVGLPLTMRGEHGPQAAAIQRFVDALAAVLNCPVEMFDERLTSVAAEQMLRNLGVKPAKIKEQIDQVAASIILQDYLDARRNPF
ncbi:Holliday junction resolvase RuvX [Chloroflexus aggregans]|uniref:Putative pre-16S rRNA nuclease n=1 Tax=Chloroflexus aggregans (strain MD-66 / DSM 9485) TaxID=326427 RepID=YQGF_CHLAD|nr:Holliday junction resolvase RuvX [Chloroflexus aggregans]B8GC73.1 RecName: Full=Putative pre-16S rRNA nuclease [Chloroflexus aggregans DSM 9485]ACL23047.1 Holliday junction resolvase YqgF [Chloroflexus aggregans DSM 9485]